MQNCNLNVILYRIAVGILFVAELHFVDYSYIQKKRERELALNNEQKKHNHHSSTNQFDDNSSLRTDHSNAGMHRNQEKSQCAHCGFDGNTRGNIIEQGDFRRDQG